MLLNILLSLCSPPCIEEPKEEASNRNGAESTTQPSEHKQQVDDNSTYIEQTFHQTKQILEELKERNTKQPTYEPTTNWYYQQQPAYYPQMPYYPQPSYYPQTQQMPQQASGQPTKQTIPMQQYPPVGYLVPNPQIPFGCAPTLRCERCHHCSQKSGCPLSILKTLSHSLEVKDPAVDISKPELIHQNMPALRQICKIIGNERCSDPDCLVCLMLKVDPSLAKFLANVQIKDAELNNCGIGFFNAPKNPIDYMLFSYQMNAESKNKEGSTDVMLRPWLGQPYGGINYF